MLKQLVSDFSDAPTYRVDLARVCNGQGAAYVQRTTLFQNAARSGLSRQREKWLEYARQARENAEGVPGDLLAVYDNLVSLLV
jgi:hypothetical protein